GAESDRAYAHQGTAVNHQEPAGPSVSLTKCAASRTMKPTSTSARIANMFRCQRLIATPPLVTVAWSEMSTLIPSTVPKIAELAKSPAIPVTGGVAEPS